MRQMRTLGEKALVMLLSLSLLLWSVLPTTNHTPAALETIQDHLEMVAEHGHSHGFEEDLLWALHGHSHDAADHDHSPLLLSFGNPSLAIDIGSTWRPAVTQGKPSQRFLIERPPRV